MTQVAGMNSAPSSRIPMAKTRQPNVYQNGYDQHKAISAPSKLEQMQMQYQHKLNRDKERRMNEINQQADHRARTFGENETDNSIVKDFFKERRAMAGQGYVPNIDQHFMKKKAEASGGGYSTQYQQKKQFGYSGRPPAHKSSAGRDKSNPLAPIDYGAKGQKNRKSSAASNGSYPMTYQKKQPAGVKSLPPSRKTSFVGSGTTTPTGYQSNGEGNGEHYSDRRNKQRGDTYDDENRAAVLSNRNITPQNKKISFKEWQQKQKRTGPSSTDNPNRFNETQDSPEKLTEFQKWQLEQDAQRADRLQKHAKPNGVTNGYHQSPTASSRNSPNKRNSPPSKNGGSSPGVVRQQKKQALLQKHINTQSKKHLYASHSTNISDEELDEDSADNGGLDESMVRKQKELEAMIKQQQDELNKMKQQRAIEEEEARKAREQEAKRIAQQQARQRRLQEAEERERREREEQERKEQEKRELDERDAQWLQEQRRAEVQANSHQAYDQGSYSKNSNSRYNSHQDEYSDPYSESQPDQAQAFIPKKPARVRNKAKKTAVPPPRKLTPEPEYYSNEEPVGYNLDTAADEAYQKVDVAPCKNCGRKFAKDRLAKHMAACKQSSKTRKVFDVSKMRTDGTDLAKYTNKRTHRPDPPKKKNNWKKQHENFIATIRYAKQVTEAESKGTSLANLPPPPVTEEPDLVPCPHCNRTFNSTAAERHIPRCKDIKTRPAPFRTHKK